MEPELFRDEALSTVEGWTYVLKSYGHVWFAIDGVRYFVFPMGPHAYGLCLAEDEATGNRPRWQFKSEYEFLNAPMYDGRSIKDRLADILSYEP